MYGPEPQARHARGRSWAPLLRRYLLPGLVCLALVVGGVLYYRELRHPRHALDAGLAAIDGHDRSEVERIASSLEQQGHPDYAAYLRAKQQFEKSERLRKSLAQLLRDEEVERAARLYVHEGAVLAAGFNPMPALLAGELGTPTFGLRLHPRRQERAELIGLSRAACLAAHEYVRQIASESPLRVEGAIIAGECLVRLGDPRGAAAAWTYVVERRPDHVDAHRHLAAIFTDTGALRAAIHHLEIVARLDPEDGRPHRQIGLLMREDKQSRLAIAAYREALRRKLSTGTRADVVKELAEIWLGEGEADYQQALETLKQCPLEYAERPEMLTARAEALWKLRSNEAEVLALVERALRLDPELVEALLLRARMLLDMDKAEAALPLLERAVRLRPHHLGVRTQLTVAYGRLAAHAGAATQGTLQAKAQESAQQRDRLQKQIEELSRLSRQAMDAVWDDQVRHEIGKLWLEMQNPGLARTWFQAALTCNPSNPQASAALAALAEGQ